MAKNKKRFFHFLKVNSVTQGKICNIYISPSPQRLSKGLCLAEDIAAFEEQKLQQSINSLSILKNPNYHPILKYSTLLNIFQDSLLILKKMNTGTNETITSEALFVKMIMTAWQTQNTRVNELLESLSNKQLLQETAPGRNTGIYLLGHLAAVNDTLFKLLDLGERLHPELDTIFLSSPDKSGIAMPSIDELKKYWNEINTTLTDHFNKMQPAEWFTRHTTVSEEDFAKEPHRNKLNVIITRTTHQSYHLGQLNYLKK
jgi:hypothetical protein